LRWGEIRELVAGSGRTIPAAIDGQGSVVNRPERPTG
jgi:hypothetical protein